MTNQSWPSNCSQWSYLKTALTSAIFHIFLHMMVHMTKNSQIQGPKWRADQMIIKWRYLPRPFRQAEDIAQHRSDATQSRPTELKDLREAYHRSNFAYRYKVVDACDESEMFSCKSGHISTSCHARVMMIIICRKFVATIANYSWNS